MVNIIGWASCAPAAVCSCAALNMRCRMSSGMLSREGWRPFDPAQDSHRTSESPLDPERKSALEQVSIEGTLPRLHAP